MAVDPQNISDTSITSGQVQFAINITNSLPINSFVIRVSFNVNVTTISKSGLSFQGGVLGNTPNISLECINGVSVISTFCPPQDRLGTIDLGISMLGGTTPNPTNGLLFKLTLDIAGKPGLSQIHFLSADLENGSGTPLNIQSSDGYFTNRLCSPNVYCKPPVAVFTVTPAVPLQNVPAIFDGSTSHTPNQNQTAGQKIVQWRWNWGEKDLEDSEFPLGIVNQTYNYAGNYTVTLSVVDTDGMIGSYSAPLLINRIIVDIGILDLSANPSHEIQPGTIVTITASPANIGTSAANITLRLFVDRKEVENKNYTLPRGCQTGCPAGPPISYSWDTSGLAVKSYAVEAKVEHLTGDNNTANDQRIVFVQLWLSQGSSNIGLSLFGTVGVSIIALIAIGIAVAMFRPKPKDEPL